MTRIWLEAANGFDQAGLRRIDGDAGHGYLDVTDKPMPTIQAGRPVEIMIYYASDNPNGYRTGDRCSIDEPAITMMAGGMGGDSISHWHLHNDSRSEPIPRTQTDKPSYSVPSMDEIRAIPWNGLTVASTFSGCGGSSLGYRMAGFRVAWANEFIPAARDTYTANKAPTTVLDGRDIRTVDPADILATTGLAPGELDLLDGSPPCASFSTAGKRQDGWGKVKAYSDTTQRTDDLFHEFARLLAGLQPRTFVAENVSGLIKGTAKGYFLEILAALKSCGYRVETRLLDAQWLGVPQARQRLIFVGVRQDLGLAPAFPKPLAYRYSVRDALPWISGLRWDSGGLHGSRVFEVGAEPMQTVQAGGGGSQLGYEVEAETDISRFAIGAEWDRIYPGQQSTKYFSLTKPALDEPSPTVTTMTGGAAGVCHPTEKRKFSIADLRRICAFPDDFVLTGTYSQQWERLGRAVPPLMMRSIAEVIRDRILLPSIAGRSEAPTLPEPSSSGRS